MREREKCTLKSLKSKAKQWANKIPEKMALCPEYCILLWPTSSADWQYYYNCFFSLTFKQSRLIWYPSLYIGQNKYVRLADEVATITPIIAKSSQSSSSLWAEISFSFNFTPPTDQPTNKRYATLWTKCKKIT